MSAVAHMARSPKGLCRMDLGTEQAKVLDDQIKLVVDHQFSKLNAYEPLIKQMKELARNCYLQGVLDGQQVRPPGVLND
jgi:hypothetical protein